MGFKNRNNPGNRISWIEDDNTPGLDEHVERLEHFAKSIEDGVIDEGELAQQEHNLVAAMRAVESDLDDETHAKVTQLLLELTAYNVMTVLHDLAVEKVRRSFT
jgi:predicted transcriptional regulator